jgi:nucleoside phosphorylase
VGSNRIVILTALPLEAAAVRAHLPSPGRHDLPAGTIVEEAVLPGTEYYVCLVCTGPGNGQAAVVAEQVISWANPAAVLVVGIAGALKGHLALGDVVATTRVLDYQGGKETAAGFKTRPTTWDGAHRLLQVAQYVDANALWLKFLPDDHTHPAPNVHFKPIASGDVVKDTNDSPLATLLDSTYNDAVAIEMEAAGVARAAHLTAVDLLVIRGISDLSDGTKASSDNSGSQQRAARHAAAFALGVIAALHAPGSASRSASAQGTATPPEPDATLDWSVLDQVPVVSWRTDLHQTYATEPATLELHLVPVDTSARLQVVRSQTLWEELAELGRARGLFGQAEALEGRPSADGAVAFVRARPGGGTTGLAVLHTGQRSAWEALPKPDRLPAAIFDLGHIATRLAALLDLLLTVPVPLPTRIVPAAGIAPAMLVSRGTVSTPPHSAVTIRANDQPVRTEVIAAVSADGLRRATAQVAEELAARLDHAFGGQCP